MEYIQYSLAWIIYFAVHSVLASNNAKEFLQKKIISRRWYRLFYNFIAVVFLLYMILWFNQMEKSLIFHSHLWIMILGVLLFVIGTYIMFLALRQYNLSEFSGTVYLENKVFDDKLNTSGLNAHVRHPIYLATLFIIWGLWLVFPNWALLVPTFVTSTYIPIGVYFEERKLLAVFGQEYEAYKQRIPMIFPIKI